MLKASKVLLDMQFNKLKPKYDFKKVLSYFLCKAACKKIIKNDYHNKL